MEFGSRDDGAWSWEHGELYSLGASSELRVVPSFVEARVQLEIKDRSIGSAGKIGSLVPGYAEAKELASKLSERTHGTTAGCRIAFDYISALSYKAVFNIRVPRFGGKELKEKGRLHGYGENTQLGLGVEFDDGWRPYRVCLTSEFIKYELEQVSLDIIRGLAKRIAADRLERPYLADQHRAQLAAIAADPPAATEQRGDNQLRRLLRIELPGARPLSANLPDSD
jgi:hypothetical protein